MKAAATLAATLALAMACVVGADVIAKRIVLWIVTIMVALAGSGCTFAYIPTDPPRIRVCYPGQAFMCDSRYEGSDM